MSGETKLSIKSGGVALVTPSSSANDEMVISGLASPFGGPPDEQGDIIDRGAYQETLLSRPSIPILYQHDQREPIGKTIWMTEGDLGLLFSAKITPTRRGADTWKLVKDSVLSGISIGYDVKQSGRTQEPGEKRRLLKIDLFELSLVTWPAAERARVTNWAASPTMQVLKDALLIADVNYRMSKGYQIPKTKMVAMIEAQQRSLEREMNDGKTARELLYEIEYELQELKKLRV
jgi:hypothetical protein